MRLGQQVNLKGKALASKSGNLSSILRTHKVEENNQLLQASLWPQEALPGVSVAPTHLNQWMDEIIKNTNKGGKGLILH